MRTIHCSKCHNDLPVEAFPSSRVTARTKKDRCRKCGAAATRAWVEANPVRKPRDRREYNAAYYTENAEHHREYAKKYRADNYERAAESVRKYQAANRERVSAVAAVWREKNVGRIRAYCAARRACRIQRTPSWADIGAIRAIYAECQRISKSTGIVHHVDHIIPLKGKNVCGLHVETNLQILTATANSIKNNKIQEAAY